MIATSGTAAGRCAAGTPCSAEPAASADADVVVITISRVLAVSPLVIGPAKLAYRPWTGLTPAAVGPGHRCPGRPWTALNRSTHAAGACTCHSGLAATVHHRRTPANLERPAIDVMGSLGRVVTGGRHGT